MFKKNFIIRILIKILSNRITVKAISVLATSLIDVAYWRRLLDIAVIATSAQLLAIAPIRNSLSSNCEHNIGYFLPYVVCCLLYVEVLGSFLNFPFSRECKQKQTSEEPSYFVII
jgi:hypothetical protein